MPTYPTFAQLFDVTLNLDYSNGGDFLAHYHNLSRGVTTEQTERLLHDETLKLIDGLRNGHVSVSPLIMLTLLTSVADCRRRRYS